MSKNSSFLLFEPPHAKQLTIPIVEALAPRILYSADAAALVAPIDAGEAIASVWTQQIEAVVPTEQLQSPSSLVVIDGSLDDLDSLLLFLESEQSGGANLDWILIDDQTDGVESVAQYLTSVDTPYDTVHLFSHGSEAQFTLGSATVNQDSLATHEDNFAAWGIGLTETADILIYACDVSANEQGKAFATQLSSVTSADIASSTNTTGHSDLDGDWVLEHTVGTVESFNLVDVDLADTWQTILALDPATADVPVVQDTARIDQLSNDTGGSQVATNGTNTVVVWTSNNEVFYRRLAFDGTPLDGIDQLVENTNSIIRNTPTVAMASNGDFVIAWRSGSNQDGDSGGIFAQRFNADGSVKARPSDAYASTYSNAFEFRVNNVTAGQQQKPSIAMRADGSFIVGWSGPYTVLFDTSLAALYAVHDVDGTRIQAGTPASIGLSTDEFLVSVATNPSDGSMIVAFQQDATDDRIQLRRISSAGNAIGGTIDLELAGKNLVNPSVGIADNGIAYVAARNNGGAEDIYLWMVDTDNTLINGSPIQVNQVTGGHLHNVEIAVQGDDTVIVAWETDQLIDLRDIVTRQFNGSGAALSDEVVVNAYTDGEQRIPSIALSGTTAIVAWSGEGALDTADIFFRPLTITQPGVQVTASASVTTEAGGDATLSVVLESEPAGNVTVNLLSSDSTEGIPALASLVFDQTNWDTPQDVLIVGQDDVVIDGDIAYNIQISVSSVADSFYDAIADSQVVLTNQDDDVPPPIDIGPVSDTDPAINEVAENSVSGSVVGVTAFADDPDVPDTVGYSITGPSAALFAVNPISGLVTTTTAGLDYESAVNHSFTIVATSTDSTTSQQSFTVAVLDQNDVAPVINAGQSFQVDENAANGTAVGTPIVTDPDTVGLLQNWSITGGTGSAAFGISAATGQLTVTDASALNFESTPSLTLLITVSDSVTTSASQTITIDLNDLNEAPLGGNATSTATEDTDYVFGLGDFSFSDPDAGDTLSGIRVESLPGAGSLVLNNVLLDGSTTLPLSVSTAELSGGALLYRPTPNANGTAVANFGIRVVDTLGLTSAQVTQTINVTGVNDLPVFTSYAGAASTTIVVSENSAAIGTVSALDPDGGPVQYFASGADAADLSVNSTTGIVSFNNTPDRESPIDSDLDNNYEITVEARDSNGTSAYQALTVTVTDQNDESPVINAGQVFTVNENAAVGTSVGTPLAVDPDTSGSLQGWAIAGGTGATTFSISPTTGRIVVSDSTALDYEVTTSMTLLITVADGVNTASTQTISVTLADLNETPLGDNATTVVNEDTDYVFTAADFPLVDPDAGDSLSSVRITALPSSGVLLLNGTELDLNTALPFSISNTDLSADRFVYRPLANASGSGADSFELQVVDSAGAVSSSNIQSINITSVNDNPTVTGSQRILVSLGGNAQISPARLAASDVEDSATTLIFRVDAEPTNGTLSLGSQVLATGDTFSQADIDTGQLSYQNAGATVDTIVLTVTDSDGGSTGGITLAITAVADAVTTSPSDGFSSGLDQDQGDDADKTGDEAESADDEDAEGTDAAVISPAAPYETTNKGSSLAADGAESSNGLDRAETDSSQRKRGAGAAGRWLDSGHYGNDLAKIYDEPGLNMLASENEWQRLSADRLLSSFGVSDLSRMADLLTNDFNNRLQFDQRVMASSVTVSASVSIGYVLWLLRSGALLSSVLATIPAWRSIDPLPVLASFPTRKDNNDDDESLEEMLDKPQAPDQKTPAQINSNEQDQKRGL